jgi:hypothetical protein
MHGNQRISTRDLGQCLHGQRAWPRGRHNREHDQCDRFDLVAGDCVGAMSNSVFEADGGNHKLNDTSQ